MQKIIIIVILSFSILSCKIHKNATFNRISAESFNNKKSNSKSIKSKFSNASGEVHKTITANKSNLLLLNGHTQLSNGQIEILITNETEVVWRVNIVSNKMIEFQNEIVELPATGLYKLKIILKDATGFYDFKWKEASHKLKKSTQKHYLEAEKERIFDKVSQIKDSITVGNMTIHNAFKHQILAHKNSTFDSVAILEKVYLPNKNIFDECLALIFGDENGKKFEPNGLYEWNKKLLDNERELIFSKLSVLDSIDLNELFRSHLNAVQELTGQLGEGKWMIYFGPKDFQIFGGCNRNTMILDMFGEAWNAKSINDLFAHEIEHLIFEPILENDPHGNSGLGITLDEGLAVYFTYIYLNQDLNEALYGRDTNLLFDKEKEIFTKLEPFLFLTGDEGCPIYRHCGRNNSCDPVIKDLPENIQDELCYFLGFRIIQKYTETHGIDSWKDLYHIPFKDFYEQSGYKEYIEQKK